MSRLTASVRDELARRLVTGVVPPGGRLPPEPDLAAELGVSRATLREALRSLEEDGLLKRTRGAGTFATRRPRSRNNLDLNFGVTEAIRAAGRRPGARDLAVVARSGTRDESRALDLEPGEAVVEVSRVRTADGRAVVWSIDVVPARLVGAVAARRLGNGSMYRLLEEESGRAVHHGVVTIEPMRADQSVAGRLGVRQGSLLLYLRQIDLDESGDPVLLSHEHHLADAFEFAVVRRGPGRRSA